MINTVGVKKGYKQAPESMDRYAVRRRSMKKEWDVTDNMGNVHHITYKAGGFGGAKYTIDNDTYKCKSKNWFVMLADNQIRMPGADCNLVVVGNSVRLAVNGVYLDDGTPYEPVRNMPGWVNVMITVCGIVGFLGAGWIGLLLSVFVDMFSIKMCLKGKNGGAIALFVGFLILVGIWFACQVLFLL